MSTLFGAGRTTYLRYAVVIELLAALAPAMRVKGRVHDPLRQTSWWTPDQHSAVLVVVIATVAGAALAYLASRSQTGRAWKVIACGVFAGLFPAAFYGVLAPREAEVPLAGLLSDGTLYGLIAGVVLYWLLKAQPAADAAATGSAGP